MNTVWMRPTSWDDAPGRRRPRAAAPRSLHEVAAQQLERTFKAAIRYTTKLIDKFGAEFPDTTEQARAEYEKYGLSAYTNYLIMPLTKDPVVVKAMVDTYRFRPVLVYPSHRSLFDLIGTSGRGGRRGGDGDASRVIATAKLVFCLEIAKNNSQLQYLPFSASSFNKTRAQRADADNQDPGTKQAAYWNIRHLIGKALTNEYNRPAYYPADAAFLQHIQDVAFTASDSTMDARTLKLARHAYNEAMIGALVSVASAELRMLVELLNFESLPPDSVARRHCKQFALQGNETTADVDVGAYTRVTYGLAPSGGRGGRGGRGGGGAAATRRVYEFSLQCPSPNCNTMPAMVLKGMGAYSKNSVWNKIVYKLAKGVQLYGPGCVHSIPQIKTLLETFIHRTSGRSTKARGGNVGVPRYVVTVNKLLENTPLRFSYVDSLVNMHQRPLRLPPRRRVRDNPSQEDVERVDLYEREEEAADALASLSTIADDAEADVDEVEVEEPVGPVGPINTSELTRPTKPVRRPVVAQQVEQNTEDAEDTSGTSGTSDTRGAHKLASGTPVFESTARFVVHGGGGPRDSKYVAPSPEDVNRATRFYSAMTPELFDSMFVPFFKTRYEATVAIRNSIKAVPSEDRTAHEQFIYTIVNTMMRKGVHPHVGAIGPFARTTAALVFTDINKAIEFGFALDSENVQNGDPPALPTVLLLRVCSNGGAPGKCCTNWYDATQFRSVMAINKHAREILQRGAATRSYTADERAVVSAARGLTRYIRSGHEDVQRIFSRKVLRMAKVKGGAAVVLVPTGVYFDRDSYRAKIADLRRALTSGEETISENQATGRTKRHTTPPAYKRINGANTNAVCAVETMY